MFSQKKRIVTSIALILLMKSGTVLAPDGFEAFQPRSAPAPADWKIFMEANESFRQHLWDYQSQRGLKLGDWAWGWRLGWTRACGASTTEWCAAILKDGLADKALLVRADAAKRIGERYAGSGDQAMIKLLEAAAVDPRNSRNGKPLIVHERILYALKSIGGRDATAAGTRIATRDAQSAVYWSRISAM